MNLPKRISVLPYASAVRAVWAHYSYYQHGEVFLTDRGVEVLQELTRIEELCHSGINAISVGGAKT